MSRNRFGMAIDYVSGSTPKTSTTICTDSAATVAANIVNFDGDEIAGGVVALTLGRPLAFRGPVGATTLYCVPTTAATVYTLRSQDAPSSVAVTSVPSVPTTAVPKPYSQSQLTPGAFSMASGQDFTATVSRTTGYVPLWLQNDRVTLIGKNFAGSRMAWSTDDGATWTEHATNWLSSAGGLPGGGQGPMAIHELDNGEIIVFLDGSGVQLPAAWLSTGWAASHATATFSKVFSMSGGNVTDGCLWYPFNVDSYGPIVLACEYGPKTSPQHMARYLRLSEDYGKTWRIIFDWEQYTTGVSAHLHAPCYDPWWDAIWVCGGDGAGNFGTYVSFDRGTSWKRVPIEVQMNSIYALPNCILFGTDIGTTAQGWYRIDRIHPDCLEGEMAFTTDTGASQTQYSERMWRSRSVPGAPLLIPFLPGYQLANSGSRLYATHDGVSFRKIWEDTGQSYTNTGLRNIVGPTTTGKYHGNIERVASSAADRYQLVLAPNAPVTAENTTWPAGALAASYNRAGANNVSAAYTTQGWCYINAVPVTRQITTSGVNWFSGTIATDTPTHQWAVLLDSTHTVVAVTADGTNTAMPASTKYAWNWAAPVTLEPGLYYVGVAVAATTAMSLWGVVNSAAGPSGVNTPLLAARFGGSVSTPPAVGDTTVSGSGTIAGQNFLMLTYLI
jgi:hypothetical protein